MSENHTAQPLVSVCIPIYNGAEFLDEMLDSLERIEYPNIEIIISDDSSTDASLQIVKKRALKNCRILEHENLGLVENWNYCLRHVNGKYVKFLFQDDLLQPSCIGKLVAIAEKDCQVGMVFSARKLLSSVDLDPQLFPEDLYLSWKGLHEIQTGQSMIDSRQFRCNPYNKIGEPTNVLIRTSIFGIIGNFDASFRQLPDLEMWCRIMTQYSVGFIEEKLASFRIHDNQTSSVNARGNRTWIEIFKLWHKMSYHHTFDALPAPTRRVIKFFFYKRVVKFIIINAVKRNWTRCKDLSKLLFVALRSQMTRLQL